MTNKHIIDISEKLLYQVMLSQYLKIYLNDIILDNNKSFSSGLCSYKVKNNILLITTEFLKAVEI